MSDFSPEYNIKTIDLKKNTALAGLITSSGYRFFDNSMLDTMRVCPRKFYFSHIRFFQPTGHRIPLIFGTAWHAAMDAVWEMAKKVDKQNELVFIGHEAFKKSWIAQGMADANEFDLHPRTPSYAHTLLEEYIDRYYTELKRIEIMAIETPFIVPMGFEDEKIYYIGKWDKVFRDYLGIQVLDHKTCSQMGNSWASSFSPNGQMDGYLHAGHMTYGPEFHGVLVDGVQVAKTKREMMRIPLQRQVEQLDAWAWEVEDLIDLIKLNEERLVDIRTGETPTENFLQAFPKCTTSCTSYFGTCPFLDICKFVNNPEKFDGGDMYDIKQWRPFEITEKLDGSFDIQPKEDV